MANKRGLRGSATRKQGPPPKRLFNMVAEEEFFHELDRLCNAERPPISRAHMLRKLVFERAPDTKSIPNALPNGHIAKTL